MAEPRSSEYDLALPPTDALETRPSPGRPASPIDDEDEPSPSPRSRPPVPPKPLPRLSRSSPPPGDGPEPGERPEAAPSPAPVSSRRRRDRDRNPGRAAPPDDDSTKTLVAPTPTLDTVEGRGRVRLALGIVAGTALLLAIVMIVRAVGGGGSADEEGVYVINTAEMFPPQNAAPGAVRNASDEDPARDLIARARAAMTIQLARSQLQRIVDTYPQTTTAAEARAALDRIAQNQPPFPDVPTLAPVTVVVAPAPSPSPANAPSAPAVATTSPPDAVGALPTAPSPTPAPPPEPAPAPEPVVRVLPDGFSPHPDAQEHPSGWPSRIVSERDGMTMVLVPGGTYILGRDGGPAFEGPSHKVALPPYYIDEHEVTVEQFGVYREAMTRRGETVEPAPEDLTRLGLTGRHPVVLTSAREALRFAEWAGKSLPTEAQWEAAARGPDALIHPWGAGPPPWPSTRTNRQLDPVGSFPADRSPSGALDLAANAWEWTSDWFDGSAYADRRGRVTPNPGGPSTPPNPPRQTVRGSSPAFDATSRVGMPVDTRLPYLGFRCALNVEGLPLPGSPPRLASPNAPATRPEPTAPRPPSQPQPRPAPNALVPF